MLQSRAIILLLFLTGFLIRLYFAATIDDVTYGTDSASRFIQAKEWYSNPKDISGDLIWLPLFRLILMSLVPFGFSAAFSASAAVLGLSSLSIPVFYLVVRKSFNAPVAFWSALLLAINPFHIKYSSWYMTENVFLFFVIVAFYLLLRFLESEKRIHLLLSALCVNAASMIRYEGWMIAALLPLFLFLKRNDMAAGVRYFLCNIACIVIFCALSYSTYGVLVYGVFMSQKEVQLDLTSKPDLFGHMKAQLSYELIYPVWLYFLVVAGIIYSLFKRYRLAYLLTWLLLFAFSAYGIITLTSQPFSRYLSCSLLMLIPFGALMLDQISKNNRWTFAAVFIFVSSFSVPAIADYYRNRKEYSMAPAEYKNACKILKDTRQGGEKVIFQIWIRGIDHDSFLEDADVERRFVYYPPHNLLSIFDDYQRFSVKKMAELISDTAYHYIFVQRNMELDSVLNSHEIKEYLMETKVYFDTIYQGGDYYLLRMERKKQRGF